MIIDDMSNIRDIHGMYLWNTQTWRMMIIDKMSNIKDMECILGSVAVVLFTNLCQVIILMGGPQSG